MVFIHGVKMVMPSSMVTREVMSLAGRVLRGGSFNTPTSLVRSAARDGNIPTERNYYVGFRLARTISAGRSSDRQGGMP